jgi:hypothetical protein
LEKSNKVVSADTTETPKQPAAQQHSRTAAAS